MALNPQDQPSVLFVAEDEEATEFAKTFLGRYNYRIFTKPNGAEAIEFAQNSDLDMLVVDIILPDMCGEDAAIEIIECSSSNLQVIFFTASIAFSDQDDDDATIDVGGKACNVICKGSPKTTQIIALQEICETIQALSA